MTSVERSYCSAPNTITGTASKRSKADANRAKLCELFIDPKLVDLKRKAMANSAAANLNQNGDSLKSSGPGAKKLEEIWVKRVNDPARRSFRVVSRPTLYVHVICMHDNDSHHPRTFLLLLIIIIYWAGLLQMNQIRTFPTTLTAKLADYYLLNFHFVLSPMLYIYKYA